MRFHIKYSFLFVLIILFPSCELLEPEDDNHSSLDRVYEDPEYAEGLLIRAYNFIPTNDYNWDEVATDDAVTNDRFSSYMRMATGEWSANYNPQDLWDNCNEAILYINHFLELVEEVPFKWTNQDLNDLYVRRLKGESYALRGLFKYYLLRNHGGIGASGQLLGTPEYNEFAGIEENFDKPRASFSESVNSAYADLEKAQEYLALDYGYVGSVDELPSEFSDITEIDYYNQVYGDVTQQRISGRIAKALKARIALLAASPAFNISGDQILWENAANYTAELLNDIGGPAGLDNKGHVFYSKEQVDAADITRGNNKDIREMLWRRPIYNNRTRERNNFPPSLYGNGRVNPTQNFVDAFPMANGYPITEAGSGYDPADPYANRDLRLSLYVVYDGSKMRGKTINTGVGTGDDGLDALQNSTRTGYYLKKMLREDVNVDPSSSSNQRHFNAHIRYTELFLNYAEAANEAWGPDGSGSHGYSAKDIITAIRERAGIEQPDDYISSLSDKSSMRTLIHNERRLELSFESFRFWDLRRWNADLAEPARGVRIENGIYSYFDVEQRVFNNDYMHYGPIPFNEITKFNLEQNMGWN